MRWIPLLLLLLLPAGICRAQVRAEGMAGAGSAIVDGVDAPALNPALLSSGGGPTLRLLDSFGALSNNSFGLSDYHTYNGADLSEADEDVLLGKIPGASLEFDGLVSVLGPALRYRSWAITSRVAGNADAGVPKELFELILDGNTPNETFSLEATSGAGALIGEVAVSHAQEVEIPGAGRWALGASVKLLRGWLYGRIEDATGTITTSFDGMEGGGEVRIRSSTGGSGSGFDLGGWRTFGDFWSLSLALRNLFAGIRWSRETKESIAHIIVEDVTLEQMEDGEDGITTDDESYAIGAFRTEIPPSFQAGLARRNGRWTFVADWVQGFEESLTTTRTPRVAVGSEVCVLGWLTGRAGISIGGIDRRSLALGLGLSPGFLRLDLALAARDGFVPLTGRGVGVGLALGAEF